MALSTPSDRANARRCDTHSGDDRAGGAYRGRHRPAGRRRRAAAALVTTLLAIGLGVLVTAGPASATVSDVPAANTPYLASPNSVILALTYCGSKIYAVGDFTEIKQGNTTYHRGYGFAFDESTGKVLAFDPRANSPISSIAMSPDCNYAYIAGGFDDVDGQNLTNLAKVGSVFGYPDTTFAPNPDHQVNSVVVVNGSTLIIGGQFTRVGTFGPPQFASLKLTNGYVTSYVTSKLSGVLPGSTGNSRLQNMQVSPNGRQLLVEGNFLSVDGHAHKQIFEMDLGSAAATLDPWSNSTINSTTCAKDQLFYMRDAAYSPDGSRIYVAATGRDGSSPYCDAVSAFANTASAPNIWVNKTGQDSLYTVAASNTDVYIGGHERWANNPKGHNNCGPGCVDRQGVGSINPSTGLATDWNPGRTRGAGADDMLARPNGLYVASDDEYSSYRCHGAFHPGLCFFPGTP